MLPPSRTLASDLGVSRWAVTQAYGQLVTEGYLESRTGSATRVLWSPDPDDHRTARRDTPPPAAPPAPPRYDLTVCTPDFRAFPRRKWVDAIRSVAETAPYRQLSYGAPGGEPRLRALLAEHLNRSRGADVEPGMLSIFSGATSAMAHLSRALFLAGHRQIGVENPSSPSLWKIAQQAGLEHVPLPTDEDGMVTDTLAGYPGLRVVAVGAAHHMVTGVPLAPHRRAALLDWARRVDGLIIEDDYDAEFTFETPVLPVMQGSDRRRVALLGSMSRALTATVSVGWVAAHPSWVDAVRNAYPAAGGPPALTQLALASFIETGDYTRHLRASRQRLRARRDALARALRIYLPEYPVTVPKAGLYVIVELPSGTDMAAIAAAARRHDIEVETNADLYFDGIQADSLLQIGYTNLNDRVIDEAVNLLAQVIRNTL